MGGLKDTTDALPVSGKPDCLNGMQQPSIAAVKQGLWPTKDSSRVPADPDRMFERAEAVQIVIHTE